MPNIWSFPSGTVEVGENIEVTAIREAMEELNVEVKVEKILWVKELTEFNVRLHFVVCAIVSGYPALKELKEIKSLRWMTFEEFFTEYSDPEIGHGLIFLRKNPELYSTIQ